MAGARTWNGAVAQLGERVVRNDEVSGSIPLGSTSFLAPPVRGTGAAKKLVFLFRPQTPGGGHPSALAYAP
jgi:hypothetical protein